MDSKLELMVTHLLQSPQPPPSSTLALCLGEFKRGCLIQKEGVYKALLRIRRALWHIHRSLLRIRRALWHIHRSLLRCVC